MTGDEVQIEMVVEAPPALVFELFVDPALLVRWIGISATLEPRPGGRFRFELFPGEFCSGEFVAVEPPHRVAFTWGWESGALPVAPGSSTVDVTLADHERGTLLRLVHRGLDGPMRAMHTDGWKRFLARLDAVATGREPPPDPAAPYAQQT
ncbi:MAG: SRPBCC domain-containing protein [Actinomycetota bacterium]|nr:SRPBCC domain-containing protein [Actinomycetota bacterium]